MFKDEYPVDVEGEKLGLTGGAERRRMIFAPVRMSKQMYRLRRRYFIHYVIPTNLSVSRTNDNDSCSVVYKSIENLFVAFN